MSTPYLIVPPGYRRYIDAHNDAAYVCIGHRLPCDPGDLLVPRCLFADGPKCLFPYVSEDLILPRRTAIYREAKARILGEPATRRCTYCMRSALRPGETWAIDHRLPVKLGGASPHWNLTLACSTCNAMKGVALWEPGHNLGFALRLAIETSDSHPEAVQTSLIDLLVV